MPAGTGREQFSNADNMALVGVLSTGLLVEQLVRRAPDRSAAIEFKTIVDRLSAGAAGDALVRDTRGDAADMTVQERVRSFVLEYFYVSDPAELTDDISLIDSGIVDSTGMLRDHPVPRGRVRLPHRGPRDDPREPRDDLPDRGVRRPQASPAAG